MPADETLDPAPAPNVRTVFIGVMLGMFLASLNQTVVSPAMPRIVAELGGVAHYSWIAVSTLLASTVVVPIAGKLSDLFGRKAFYVGGIVLFMASSVVAGLAPTFEVFMVARVLEGMGMGTMMPLSQAIIGDLIPPRERGRYQGLMGAVFGLSSVIGPLVGGYITDHFSWRWLFLVNPPVALLALAFIVPFMKLPAARRRARIDYAGFVTLTCGLTPVLLATVWGGTSYPWGSPVIVGLFAGGAAMLGLFVWVERRAEDPVMPLRLWRSRVFALANLANMAVAMAMFGAIYFIPVFVQGVIGISVTASGAVLTPMMLALVTLSAVNGQIVSRTGRYKVPMLVGITLIAIGFFLLTRMDTGTTRGYVVRSMIVVGAGLGMCMQLFVLIVQNGVARGDLGVATATTQLFRSIGSSVGIAVMGTLMTQGLAREVPRRLAGLDAGGLLAGGGEGAGAVLDPTLLARLPAATVVALRGAFAAALHPVFLAGLPIVLAALAVALFIPEVPLRRTPQGTAEDAGRGVLAEMAQAGADDEEPALGQPSEDYRARTAFLGLLLTLVAEAEGGTSGRLHPVLQRLGEGDAELGRERARRLGTALLRESEGEGEIPPLGLDPLVEFERALAARPSDFRQRLRRLLQEMDARPTAVLSADDIDTLERIAVAAGTAALLDRRPAG